MQHAVGGTGMRQEACGRRQKAMRHVAGGMRQEAQPRGTEWVVGRRGARQETKRPAAQSAIRSEGGEPTCWLWGLSPFRGESDS